MSAPVALVTGAAQGIGRAIAIAMAAEGYGVGITAEEPAGETEAEIRDAGARCVASRRDFTVPGEAAGFVAEAAEALGGVDVLVNNAGVTLDRPVEDTTLDQLDRILAINLRAAFEAIRAARPWMLQRGGGSVINVSSIHAGGGLDGHSAYAASKGAIEALTRQLAVELGPAGVRVNAVAPGLVMVPRLERFAGSTQVGDQIPLRRPGTPAEVAAVVTFLAGTGSSYITGQVIGIDGGLSAKMRVEL